VQKLARYQVVLADGWPLSIVRPSPRRSLVARRRAQVPQATNKENSMPFGQAIEALKAGKRVSRAGWNGKGMWLALELPDANSKMTAPYIYMKTADDKLVPWLASQTDVLAEDWGEVQ
jgi:hypothetical protein